MRAAWTISTYIRSKTAEGNRPMPMMQITQVFFGIERPSDGEVLAAVERHTRNCLILFSEVEFTPLPDEFLSAD